MNDDITKQDQEFENATPTPTPPVTPDPEDGDAIETPTPPEKKDEEIEDPFLDDEDIVAKKTAKKEDEEEDTDEPGNDIEDDDDKLLNDKIAKALESHPKIKLLDEREAKLNVDEFLAKPENEVFKKHKDTIVKYVQNPKLKGVFKADRLTEVAALLAAGRGVWGAVKQVQDNADAEAEANKVTTPTQRQESGRFDYMTATPEQLAKREALILAGKVKL